MFCVELRILQVGSKLLLRVECGGNLELYGSDAGPIKCSRACLPRR